MTYCDEKGPVRGDKEFCVKTKSCAWRQGIVAPKLKIRVCTKTLGLILMVHEL